MKKNYFFLAILLFMGGFIITSCEKEDELSANKEILSFIFEASKNAELESNVIGTISGTDIIAEVPFGTSINALIPSIETSNKAELGPAGGVSTDFTNPVIYTVTAEDGSTKTFTVTVPVAPAPYIGSWMTSTSVNIENLGLSKVTLDITENGEITMKLQSTLTGQIFAQSVKGNFDALSKCNTDICLEQTHRWLDDQWTPENAQHCMMYYCTDNHMEFKYCLCYPKDQWWFTIELVKD